MAILRLYLRGLSYSQISAQAGVSKGAVANLVAELRAGRFPEAADVSAQVDALRELAVDLAKAKLTPGQALMGVAVLSQLRKLAIEPGDIDRWAALCRQLAPEGTETAAFVSAALALEEVRRQTGHGPEALEKKVRGLQEQASQLEARVQALREEQKKLDALEARRQALEGEVAELERRRQALSGTVKEKEQREADLAHLLCEALLPALTETQNALLALMLAGYQCKESVGSWR